MDKYIGFDLDCKKTATLLHPKTCNSQPLDLTIRPRRIPYRFDDERIEVMERE